MSNPTKDYSINTQKYQDLIQLHYIKDRLMDIIKRMKQVMLKI